MLDCILKVGEFELHSHNYIHFWTNTLGKGKNLLSTSYELNSITAIILQG